jgi:DNA adenine methylase
MEIDLKPVMKWAGGKRNIMERLLSYFPSEFKNYHEPFLGGGSVVLEMTNRGLLKNKKVHISDIMEPLMNVYRVIKEDVGNLINELKSGYTNDKETFMDKRNRFNEIKRDIPNNTVECAALFLYLNRTCFNGIYRENNSGGYNVPFGKQKNPLICNEALLRQVGNWLRGGDITLRHCGYEETIGEINEGDFVYMDPPYYGTFTDYNKDAFGERSQEKLRDFYRELCRRGCKVALSNSNHEYIRKIYSDIPNVRFIEIPVKRMINSKGEDRKKVMTEVLIVNY